jgi:hypothetical protein
MSEVHGKHGFKAACCSAPGWLLLICFALGGGLLGDIYVKPGVSFFEMSVPRIRVWQCLYGLGFAGYALLLWNFSRRSIRTRTIVIAAVLLRLPLLLVPPNSDCNRYIWEGRIQRLGFNPYVYAPQDEVLRELRDDTWEGINKKHYSTIYPPLAQLEFRLLSVIHYSVKSPQVAHAIEDVCVVLALAWLLAVTGQPAWYVAIYALCPLVLAAFAHAGHNDSLMILGVLGFIAAGRKKLWVWAGLALGLAILAKTTPAILLATLLRRSKLAIGVALAVVVLGYLLYIDAGRQKLFETLHEFPSQSRFNNLFDELRVWINEQFGPVLWARGRMTVTAGVLICAAAYRAWRARELLWDACWLMAFALVALPIIHFWYVTWVMALVALRPKGQWAWVVLAGTMVLYWQADLSHQVGGRWMLPTWAVVVIWVPFFVAWIGEAIWRRRGSGGASPATPSQ